MPAPAAAAAVPLLVKAMPAIVAGVNAGIQGLTNLSNRKTAFAMYDKQRTDALADWNMNNQYNSPSAQMQRFKDAGLSPHLIYGQTNTAPPVRSVSADTPKAIAPQIDQSAANFPQYSLMLETAQQNLQNLKAQEDLIKANKEKAESETDWKKLNNDWYDKTWFKRMEILNNQALQTGSTQRLTEEQITGQQERNKNYIAERENTKARTKSILAQTDLSVEQKAQVMQMTENAKETFKILTEKAQQEKFETEFMQKLKALGLVGQMAYMIARVAKGK